LPKLLVLLTKQPNKILPSLNNSKGAERQRSAPFSY
jgi:hypothetical protein